MQLTCQSCGKMILAEDINIQLAIAKCGACHAVFNFAETVGGLPSRKPTANKPKQIELIDTGSELAIRWRWFSHAVWFLVVFCLFWDGFLVLWYSIGLAQLWGRNADFGAVVMLLFPVIHLAIGVGLTYFVISTFVNRTSLLVALGQLEIKHGPLPWPGNCVINVVDIEQFFCVEKFGSRKSRQSSFELHVLLRSGEKKKLLSAITEEEFALFLEQTLETHLGIEDRPVAGEYRF